MDTAVICIGMMCLTCVIIATLVFYYYWYKDAKRVADAGFSERTNAKIRLLDAEIANMRKMAELRKQYPDVPFPPLVWDKADKNGGTVWGTYTYSEATKAASKESKPGEVKS
jgi:hypothetical protein